MYQREKLLNHFVARRFINVLLSAWVLFLIGLVMLVGPSSIKSEQLHGVIVNQADSPEALRIEQELSILWYLDNHPVNSNLVISEILSMSASREIIFLYDGVVVKKLRRQRRFLQEDKMTAVVNEIYRKVKKIDNNKRAAVLKKLISKSKVSPAYN